MVGGAGHIWAQLFLHGSLITVVAAFIEPPRILAGEKPTSKLRTSPRFGLWLDRSLGTILIALCQRLMLDQH